MGIRTWMAALGFLVGSLALLWAGPTEARAGTRVLTTSSGGLFLYEANSPPRQTYRRRRSNHRWRAGRRRWGGRYGGYGSGSVYAPYYQAGLPYSGQALFGPGWYRISYPAPYYYYSFGTSGYSWR